MKKLLTQLLIISCLCLGGCSLFSKKVGKNDVPMISNSPSNLTQQNSVLTNSNALTLENYEKIKNEMSYEDIVNLLGSGGNETRRSNIGNIELRTYKWKGENYKRIYADFRNNKLFSKSQNGLE